MVSLPYVHGVDKPRKNDNYFPEQRGFTLLKRSQAAPGVKVYADITVCNWGFYGFTLPHTCMRLIQKA